MVDTMVDTSELALYEALLFEPGRGYFLLREHLERLAASAAHFGFRLDPTAVECALTRHARGLDSAVKVRLIAQRDGALRIENAPLRPSTPLRCALAETPVDSQHPFLRHKTSRRGVYERALSARLDVDDVVLHNERGELTETTAGNLVLELAGRALTPHADAGLLPGTYRRHLLERGEVQEARLVLADLRRATCIWMINSVRRRCRIDLMEPESGAHRDDRA